MAHVITIDNCLYKWVGLIDQVNRNYRRRLQLSLSGQSSLMVAAHSLDSRRHGHITWKEEGDHVTLDYGLLDIS